jgi:hypothetical protein
MPSVGWDYGIPLEVPDLLVSDVREFFRRFRDVLSASAGLPGQGTNALGTRSGKFRTLAMP